MSDHTSRYEQGMKTRRKVLGNAHVDRAQRDKQEFDAPFQEMITETAWGHVWSGSNVSDRERSMMTIALLAGLGHEEELAMHIRSTANTGASMDDVREALMHVAIYAGVPAANTAFRIAKQTYAKMESNS